MPVRLLLLAVLLCSTNARAAELQPALKAAIENARDTCYASGEESPRDVICDAIQHEDVIAIVAEKFGISRDATVVIVEAQLRIGEAQDQLPANVRDELAARIRTTLSEPNRLPAIVTLAELDLDVLPLLEEEKDPTSAITRVLSFLMEPARSRLLFAAAAIHRDDGGLLALLSEQRGLSGGAFGPFRILERRVELRGSSKKLSPSILAARAASQMADLVALARPGEALAVLAALPANTRDLIVSGKTQNEDGSLDVRLQLAAAWLAAGDVRRTREILRNVPVPTDDLIEPKGAYEVLRYATQLEPSSDLFDVIATVAGDHRWSTAGTVGLTYATLLERHGYQDLAVEALRDGAEGLFYGEQLDAPPALAADVEPLRNRIRTDVARLRARADAPAPPRGSTEAIARLLRAPRLALFREHRLPDEIASSATVIDCGDAHRVAATTNLPPFVWPIRMERHDAEIVAVGISQALDPIGELGRGGYWVLRSLDSGATWKTYYTGLRENMPYVVVQASRLPLLGGSHLRIEVEIQELDLNSITFPPIALRTTRSEKGVYVEFAWSDLTRDTDGDGLTDLLDERIVTDPDSRDTDGDGLEDGVDSLPQVALTGAANARSEILASVFSGFYLGGGAAIVGIASGQELANACSVRMSRVADSTLFIVADASAFAAVDLPRRAVVLTPAEMELYSAKFGPTYGATIRNFAIDHSGKHAVIELNESWKGGTYLLTKTDDGWTSESIGFWIS